MRTERKIVRTYAVRIVISSLIKYLGGSTWMYLSQTICNEIHIFPMFVQKQTEFLRRNSSDMKEAAYKGVVGLGSSVWDPHSHGLHEELKRSKIVLQCL